MDETYSITKFSDFISESPLFDLQPIYDYFYY